MRTNKRGKGEGQRGDKKPLNAGICTIILGISLILRFEENERGQEAMVIAGD